MRYKIIFFLIVLFFYPSFSFAQSSSCSKNGYTILTLNGIFTDEHGADVNRRALERKLGGLFNNEPLSVDFIYNPTHLAGVGDLVGAVSQKLFENKNIDDYDMVEILNSVSDKLHTQKLLLVAHSQGNFYANSFYKIVADAPGGIPKESIGVYGVASPASYVAGDGKYITSSTDSVINATRALGLFNVLPANTNIKLLENSNGHSFSDVYLKYQGERMINEIKDSLNKLSDNNIQANTEPCISGVELNTFHKIQKVTYQIADPTAIFLRDNTLNTGTYLANLVADSSASLGSLSRNILLALNSKFNNLTANVVESIPDGESLATISNLDTGSNEVQNTNNTTNNQTTDQGSTPNVQDSNSEIPNTDKDNNVELLTQDNTTENLNQTPENVNLNETENQNTQNPVVSSGGPVSGITIPDDSNNENLGANEEVVSENTNIEENNSNENTDSENIPENNTSNTVIENPPLNTLTITEDTTLLPGEYTYDNLVITNNAVLKLSGDFNTTNSFKGVSLNVYNLTIDEGSSISANGEGLTPENNINYIAGSSFIPSDLGKGGVANNYRGGGAIKINVANTFINNGIVSADALPTAGGGSIFVTTKNMQGTGAFSSAGGSYYNTAVIHPPGAGGNISIHYEQLDFTGKITNKGGCVSYNGYSQTCSDSGLLSFFDKKNNKLVIDNSVWQFRVVDSPFNFKEIILKNNAIVNMENMINIGADTLLVDQNSKLTFGEDEVLNIGNIILNNNADVALSSNPQITSNLLEIKGGSTLTVLAEKVLYLNSIFNINIEEGSNINADSKGYRVSSEHIGDSGRGGVYGGNSVNSYGSAFKPVDFGDAGGAPNAVGGGVVYLSVSGTLTNNGRISANGSTSSSGGSVFINSKNLAGSGVFAANGGGLGFGGYFSAPGTGGRVNLHYELSSFIGTFEAKGGCGSYNGYSQSCSSSGSAGMYDVVKKNLKVSNAWQFLNTDDQVLFNEIFIEGAEILFGNEAKVTAENLIFDKNSKLILQGNESLDVNFLELKNGSTFTTLPEKILYIEIPNIKIDSTSSIIADNLGYMAGPGNDLANVAGSSYGGKGGGLNAMPVYGSAIEPLEFGSGTENHRGGGAIHLVAVNNFENNGTVSVNGSAMKVSGGSILINTNNLSGNGIFQANGGNSGWPYGSVAGGGGRIALHYKQNNFLGNAEALGGKYCYSGCALSGENGTVNFIDDSASVVPDEPIPEDTNPDPLDPNLNDPTNDPVSDPVNEDTNTGNSNNNSDSNENNSTKEDSQTDENDENSNPNPNEPLKLIQYTLNQSNNDLTINPLVNNVEIFVKSNKNVNWLSLKIERVSDGSFYKIFQSGANCVDGTDSCKKIWDGTLSSGGLLQPDLYKIKVRMKDIDNNIYDEYLPISIHVI